LSRPPSIITACMLLFLLTSYLLFRAFASVGGTLGGPDLGFITAFICLGYLMSYLIWAGRGATRWVVIVWFFVPYLLDRTVYSAMTGEPFVSAPTNWGPFSWFFVFQLITTVLVLLPPSGKWFSESRESGKECND